MEVMRFLFYIFVLLIPFVSVSSCQGLKIEKRKYRRGFNVEWNHSLNEPTKLDKIEIYHEKESQLLPFDENNLEYSLHPILSADDKEIDEFKKEYTYINVEGLDKIEDMDKNIRHPNLYYEVKSDSTVAKNDGGNCSECADLGFMGFGIIVMTIIFFPLAYIIKMFGTDLLSKIETKYGSNLNEASMRQVLFYKKAVRFLNIFTLIFFILLILLVCIILTAPLFSFFSLTI